MKQCRSCQKSLALSEFYRHPEMGDGRLNICKGCVKARVRQHREENLERIQEYDRKRGALPHRKLTVKKRYRKRISTKEGRDREWKRSKKRRDNNKIKRAAHILTNNAIKSGKLISSPCERCGSTKKIHAHHEDYLKPLEVTWLCPKCHGIRHREINEERRKP